MNKNLTGVTVPEYRAPTDRPLQILIIGAHPDDGEVKAGGSAALWSKQGDRVKIVSLTDGRCGHFQQKPDELVERRKLEAKASAEILGVEAEILDNPDAALTVGLKEREQVVRLIREWRADLVLTHRPNDYHPDHRYGSLLVQDASFLVSVPHYLPEVPHLEKLPVFLFFHDNFQQPNPFQPDVLIDIDSVAETKLDSFLAIRSQFLEWLPSIYGLKNIPKDREGERRFIREHFLSRDQSIADRYRQKLIESYGKPAGEPVRYAEAFQLSEYGNRPSPDELQKLFPKT